MSAKVTIVSQAKSVAKYDLFALSIQELDCYILQSRYSCVNLIYRKSAAFLLPAVEQM